MNRFLILIALSFSCSISFAQAWMTNLEVAERLALTQNKLLVVVWEDTYYNDFPVFVYGDSGKEVLVDNMFVEPVIDSLMWEHFVPVMLKENVYSDLFGRIEGKRSTNYIEKFNNESLKIMDANGNILNPYDDGLIINIQEFVLKYSMDTSFLNQTLVNYKREQNFYSALYLASKYIDFAYLSRPSVRPEIVDLASIYLDEASEFLKNEDPDKAIPLKQRIELLEIKKLIPLQDSKKALKKLNRIKDSKVEKVNANLRSELYYSIYKMLGDHKNASIWEPNVLLWKKKKLLRLIQSLSN